MKNVHVAYGLRVRIFALQARRVIEKLVFNFKPFSTCLENNLYRVHAMSTPLSIPTNESFFTKQNSVVYEDQKKEGKKEKMSGSFVSLPLGFKKHGNPFALGAVATVFNYRQSSE